MLAWLTKKLGVSKNMFSPELMLFILNYDKQEIVKIPKYFKFKNSKSLPYKKKFVPVTLTIRDNF